MKWARVIVICSAGGLLIVAGVIGVLRAQQPSAGAIALPPAEAKPGQPGAKVTFYQQPAATSAAPAAVPALPGPNTSFQYWPTYAPNGPLPFERAEPDDPETAWLKQSDAVMAQQSEQLVAKYAATEQAEERGAIKTQLTELLAKHFDVQQQLRERELGRVEARIKKLRELAQKRREAQKTIVEQRVDQLLREADGLGWTPPAGSLSAEPKGQFLEVTAQPGRVGAIPAASNGLSIETAPRAKPGAVLVVPPAAK
jgi:hypothetical protein